jgi:hypothetical protein
MLAQIVLLNLSRSNTLNDGSRKNVQFIRIKEAQYHAISRRRCLHARKWTHLFAQRSRRATSGRTWELSSAYQVAKPENSRTVTKDRTRPKADLAVVALERTVANGLAHGYRTTNNR